MLVLLLCVIIDKSIKIKMFIGKAQKSFINIRKRNVEEIRNFDEF